MDFKDLRNFIKIEDSRLKQRFSNKDKEKRILARMVKLTEEVGELSDAVLSYNGLQRQEKLDSYDNNKLIDEFSDVIITTFLLAEVMKVNIEEAINKKIKKINDRYKNKRKILNLS